MRDGGEPHGDAPREGAQTAQVSTLTIAGSAAFCAPTTSPCHHPPFDAPARCTKCIVRMRPGPTCASGGACRSSLDPEPSVKDSFLLTFTVQMLTLTHRSLSRFNQLLQVTHVISCSANACMHLSKPRWHTTAAAAASKHACHKSRLVVLWPCNTHHSKISPRRCPAQCTQTCLRAKYAATCTQTAAFTQRQRSKASLAMRQGVCCKPPQVRRT